MWKYENVEMWKCHIDSPKYPILISLFLFNRRQVATDLNRNEVKKNFDLHFHIFHIFIFPPLPIFIFSRLRWLIIY